MPDHSLQPDSAHMCVCACRGVDIKPDYANVASVVFSSPQVAQVGINEDKAVEEHGDVDIFTSTFSWVPWLCLHRLCWEIGGWGGGGAGSFTYLIIGKCGCTRFASTIRTV